MKTLNKRLQKAVNDRRYSIASEFCGRTEACYVVRFCDKWIGQYEKINDAVIAAIVHKGTRIGLL